MINQNEEYDESSDSFPKKENNFPHLLSFMESYNDLTNYNSGSFNKENNDNINIIKNYSKYFNINSFQSLKLSDNANSIKGKKELNTMEHFIKKKRNHDRLDSIHNELNSIEEKVEIKILDENNTNKKMGRRLKKEIYNSKAKHDKFSEDNIIIKIKTYVFKYILHLLNESLEKSKYKFYPLNTQLNININRNYNIKLLDRTIYDLNNNEDLNKNYINGNDSNKILIKKIYEENVEKKTLKILKMKFQDVLNLIREKDLENFLEKIKEKEKKNKGKSIDSYMELVNYLLKDYENWFKRKNGRNTNKKIKNKTNK